MPRRPELSDEEHIERQVQRFRDFESDRHPSARQCEDHDVGAALIADERGGEAAAGVMPVGKERHRHGIRIADLTGRR